MKPIAHIVLCAAGGWLIGEAVSRMFLREESSQSGRAEVEAISASQKHVESPAEVAAREWREFLDRQQITAPQSVTPADSAAGETNEGNFVDFWIGLKDPGSRLGFTRQLAHAAPGDFPELLEWVTRISDARVQRQVAGAFFAAWAEHDPRAAVDAVSRVPGRSMASLNGVLKSWAEKDPRGMLEWLNSPDTFGWAKMQAETNAFVYLVESDPLQAMQLAAAYDRSGKREAQDTVFKNWHRRDPDGAEQWITTAPEEDRRELFQAWIMARTGQDPGTAWQLVLTQHPDRSKLPQLLPAVFSAWREKEPAAAHSALLNVPAEIWQPSFASLIGDMLGQKKTDALEAVAAKIPETAQASFWAGVASGAIESNGDPVDAAAAFAHLREDNEDRMDLAGRITQRWLKVDPAAASEWVRNLPRGLARDFASASLAEGLVLTDAEAAAVWAADIQNDKMRGDVLKRIGQ